MPVIDNLGLIRNRVESISQFHKSNGMDRAQVDVSGGVDSAVVLALLSEALGPRNVCAVYSDINSSKESEERAKVVANALDIKLVTLQLSDDFEVLRGKCRVGIKGLKSDDSDFVDPSTYDPTVDGSLRSCLRAVTGRYMNRLSGNGIRHGTGNEDEDRWLRFFQKGGDGEVDTNPIGILSKGEVYQLAYALGIPAGIIDAEPSPDLHGINSGHSDERELNSIYGFPWTYSRIDSLNGEYTRVGTIELMSRVLGTRYTGADVIGEGAFDEILFLERPISDAMVRWMVTQIQNFARPFDKISDMSYEDIARKMLTSCQQAERNSRHKANFNIPTLGTRISLVEAGILTNELPTG